MYYWKGGSPSFFAIANYNYTLTETTISKDDVNDWIALDKLL